MSGRRGPIFIGGLSHSGKTQLRVVLGAHPDISMTRRTYMWDRFYQRFGDLRRERNLDRCLCAMIATEGIDRLHPDVPRIRAEFVRGPRTYARLFSLFHRQHAERLGKDRWGDQLGFVERFADPIFDAFSSARMIHMIRDPRGHGGGRERRRPGSLGWETARWLHSADLAQRNQRAYPGRYLVVRYEQLASLPERTVRDVCDFLDEAFDGSMAEALATVRFDLNGGTRFPPAASGADRAFVEAHAATELLAFDYAVTRPTPGKSSPHSLVDRQLDRAAMRAWRILEAGSRLDGVRRWA
jgi:Sulfotransferase family